MVPLSALPEPERSQAMAGLISAAERKSGIRPAARVLGMEGDFRKRIAGDPPIAVVLLDRLVGDDRRIIGDAGFSKQPVEHAEIGGDETTGARRGHCHQRRGRSGAAGKNLAIKF